MKRILPVAATLILAGCGYVGDPLPPLANVPGRVTDLAAMQRGGRIIVQFTAPTVTTEGHPIPPPVQLDLRAGTAEHFDENQWAADARKIPKGAAENGAVRYEIPAADWTAKEVIFGVRAVGGNGKHGAWSNFAVVPVVAPPDKPAAVTATATAEGVRLTWQANGTFFHVFRKSGDGDSLPAATVKTPEWTDNGTEYGKRYTYVVQNVVALSNSRQAESELSDEASIVPRDTFPPAAPKGVRAQGAPNSIELNWDRNAEGDLSGYRVYRGEGNGALEKVADVSVVPNYSDRRVERGKTYRYAITAVDQAGNESQRSEPVEAALP